MEIKIIDGRKFIWKDENTLVPLSSIERILIQKLADKKGIKLSLRKMGRLVRTYNNTGINLPISQLLKEINEGKRDDFYDKAEELNKLCNNGK